MLCFCRLQNQLELLKERLSVQKNEQESLMYSISVLEEADKALGRGGIPSFVLESVLGELQTR